MTSNTSECISDSHQFDDCRLVSNYRNHHDNISCNRRKSKYTNSTMIVLLLWIAIFEMVGNIKTGKFKFFLNK